MASDFNTISNTSHQTYASLLPSNDNMHLGPHNTLGTTFTTVTNTTCASNISPHKQIKKLIPDSLVKMPKFSLNIQKSV